MTADQVRATLERVLCVVPPPPNADHPRLAERAGGVISAIGGMLESLGEDRSDASWRTDPVCRELAEQLLERQAEWYAVLQSAKNRSSEQQQSWARARRRGAY